MTGVFVAPAAGGTRFHPSPPEKEHEEETPNPMNGAILSTLGFGALATMLEVMEAGDNLSTEQAKMGVYNENAIRPENMFKPGNGIR